MKIDFSIIKIQKIFYRNKYFDINTFSFDETGIYIYFNDDLFLNEYALKLYEQFNIDFLHCITESKNEITIFNVCFTFRVNSVNEIYVCMSFTNIVSSFVDNYVLACDKLIVKIDNKKIVMTNFFEFNSIKLNDNIFLSISNDNFIFNTIKNKTDTDKIYCEFIYFYEYLNLLCGFFPEIKTISYFNGVTEYKYIFNLAEKYITKKGYIKNDLFFTNILTEEEFYLSYYEFIKIRQKASLPFDVYYISTMSKNSYPEYAIVNILQSFDGIYESLSIFSSKIRLFNDSIKYEIIKKYKETDLTQICGAEIFDKNRINGLLGYINCPSNSMKLDNILNISEIIFEEEKKKNIGNKNYYSILLKKFVNTRNKFSHAKEENFIYLSGTESALYINKLFLVFRLCIMSEIKIDNKINNILLKDYIYKLNIWIFKTLDTI